MRINFEDHNTIELWSLYIMYRDYEMFGPISLWDILINSKLRELDALICECKQTIKEMQIWSLVTHR